MKILVLFLSLSCFSLLANDAPIGEIVKLKGTVTFEGKALKIGDKIEKEGLLVSAKKSFVQIAIAKWNNKITIGPSSEMAFNLKPDAKKKYSFISGRCRWKSDAGKKGKGVLYTKVSSMGVRGTDFTVVANKVLGETEIIVLDGAVQFDNLLSSGDGALVKKGQWGGIGGRFGEKIGKIIDLPRETIELFESQLNFK